MTPPAKRIVRLPGAIERTGFSRATIYRLMGKNKFPRAIKLSDRAMGWLESDIDAWLNERREGSEA